MKKSALAFVILILSSFSAFATVYHSDGSAINVQYIHNTQAVDGDTVTLPAGTFAWSTSVIITKANTLQGQTTVNSDTGTSNDSTVLIDNEPVNASQLVKLVTAAGKNYRGTGITFSGVC